MPSPSQAKEGTRYQTPYIKAIETFNRYTV
jgi:hypothetical protein